MYLYRIDYNAHGLRVEVGIFDPNRWPDSEFGPGGISFGESAEVQVSSRLHTDASYTAEVSMGAIGSHDTAVAKRRIDVYSQAAQIADFITDSLSGGVDIESIGAFLDANLAQDKNAPAAKPFRYGGNGPSTTDEIEEWYA